MFIEIKRKISWNEINIETYEYFLFPLKIYKFYFWSIKNVIWVLENQRKNISGSFGNVVTINCKWYYIAKYN